MSEPFASVMRIRRDMLNSFGLKMSITFPSASWNTWLSFNSILVGDVVTNWSEIAGLNMLPVAVVLLEDRLPTVSLVMMLFPSPVPPKLTPILVSPNKLASSLLSFVLSECPKPYELSCWVHYELDSYQHIELGNIDMQGENRTLFKQKH